MLGRILKNSIPGLTVGLATLLSALPWGMPSEIRFLLPMLPYTAIHVWAVRRPSLMPEWLAFASGLATDVLTHGPLGFWSLIFLIGLMVVHASRPARRWGAIGCWLHFCLTLAVLAVVQWLLAAIFFMNAVDWRPFFGSAVLAALSYPFLSLLFAPLDRLWPAALQGRFERGA